MTPIVDFSYACSFWAIISAMLLLFVYLLLAHLELLLLHTVVGYPELDAEPYKG
jgi:hypothetical protein